MYIRILLFGLLYSFSSIYATTYTVTNTNDTGVGSLRQAITDANTNIGRDSITFDIAGVPPHTITLVTGLPIITDTLWIDGATQPDNGFGGTDPKIVIEGVISSSAGISVQACACEVYRLRITNCFDGIEFIGFVGPGILNNFIVEENVIDNYSDKGIQAFFTSGGVIRRNYLGVYPGSSTCIPGTAGNEAIAVQRSTNILVTENVMPCSSVALNISESNSNVITANEIYSSENDCNDFNQVGILVRGTDNQVGGTAAGEANLISSRQYGIEVEAATSLRNTISGNILQCNSNEGIRHLSNGNNNKVSPIITFAGPALVTGTATPGDVIEVFRQPDNGSLGCVFTAVPQGDLYFGTATADGAGNWVLADVFEGEVTATATDVTNGTSTFATAVATGQPYATAVGNCSGAVLDAFPGLLEIEEVRNQQVKLIWQTSQLDQLDQIYLQRSQDGSLWESIYTVDIATSRELASQTTLWDPQPLEGVNYYRITYQRKDDITGYSNAVSAQILGIDLLDVVLLNHPSSKLKLQAVGGNFTEGTHIRVRELSGKTVWQGRVRTSDATFELPSTAITGGMYIVEVHTAGRSFLKKWMKH